MREGTLPEEKFKYYIAQDYLYLKEFSKVLSLLSAKADDSSIASVFSEHVQHVRTNEERLHEYYFSIWGKIHVEPSPTNLLYTSFLLSTVYSRPFHEGVSAVLPCYWIYMKVGESLGGSSSPLYDRWIKNYSGKDYETGVNQVLEIVKKLEVNENEEESMMRRFRTASILEYMFWDSAYKIEKFPFRLE